MPAAITCVPAAPVAVKDACFISVSGAAENTSVGYNTANYPSSPEVRYQIVITKGSDTVGKSPVFGTSADGDWDWMNHYVFPTSGSHTLTLKNAGTDATVATLSVTVS